MKLMNILAVVLSTAVLPAAAQNKAASLDIKSSVLCETCEKTIESELIYEKGVKKVDVNVESNTIHVEYDDRKTDPAAIRTAITALGYDADDMKADPKAFSKLPACCQKENSGGDVHP
jgi:copper chaperone CopZ